MRAGSTLIEVMISCLILAILSIASTAYLGKANSMVANQRNRMSAVATANGYVEEIHATDWWNSSMTNQVPKNVNTTNTIRRTASCTWSTNVAAGVNNYVTNNGISMTVLTKIYCVDADGGVGTNCDCVGATVTVNYRPGQNDQVVRQTLAGAPW